MHRTGSSVSHDFHASWRILSGRAPTPFQPPPGADSAAGGRARGGCGAGLSEHAVGRRSRRPGHAQFPRRAGHRGRDRDDDSDAGAVRRLRARRHARGVRIESVARIDVARRIPDDAQHGGLEPGRVFHRPVLRLSHQRIRSRRRQPGRTPRAVGRRRDRRGPGLQRAARGRRDESRARQSRTKAHDARTVLVRRFPRGRAVGCQHDVRPRRALLLSHRPDHRAADPPDEHRVGVTGIVFAVRRPESPRGDRRPPRGAMGAGNDADTGRQRECRRALGGAARGDRGVARGASRRRDCGVARHGRTRDIDARPPVALHHRTRDDRRTAARSRPLSGSVLRDRPGIGRVSGRRYRPTRNQHRRRQGARVPGRNASVAGCRRPRDAGDLHHGVAVA